jgi:hypothetical protein
MEGGGGGWPVMAWKQIKKFNNLRKKEKATELLCGANQWKYI